MPRGDGLDRRTMLRGGAAAWLAANMARGGETSAQYVVNARIFGRPDADAIVIRQGKITAVGRRERIAADSSDGTILDAAQGLVVPGFHDSHLHMGSGGDSLRSLDLTPFRELPAALEAIQRHARANPGAGWLRGRGWQYALAPVGQFPTRQDLDRVVSDRPVALVSFDGHSLWANSRALEVAEITADTPDPRGGRIVREGEGRVPSGILLESAASLVIDRQPVPSRAEKLARIAAGVEHCVRLGITSATDVYADVEDLELYQELLDADRLPLRVTVSLPLAGDLDQYVELRRKYASPFLRLGFLKDFVDGVIESKTAYMLAPYDGTNERGKPLLGRGRLEERMEAATARGFTVGLHSIGDAATRLALDSFLARGARRPSTNERGEKARAVRGRLEHLEIVDPADLKRFAAAGVVASMQPLHANPAGPTPDEQVWAKLLGPARLRHTFPWRALADAGATLAFGSDWPVMSADPLHGIAVAVTRRDAQGDPREGWNAHQCLTVEEAIRAYSEGAAQADGTSAERGRLAVGQDADLVVLAPHVDFGDPRTLWSGSRIRAVLVAGVVRYDATTTTTP